MKVIVGLGNPGKEYARTRHNVGWWVVDHLADVWRFDGWKKDAQALVCNGMLRGTRVRLVKPLTYMNLSGAVLAPYRRRLTWSARSDLLVIVDDVAIPVGTFRLRAKGSTGGHNGLKSIQAALDSLEYARMRVGIRPEDERRMRGDLADFVLDEFGRLDAAAVEELLPRMTEAVEVWVKEGVEAAMTQCNGDGTSTSGE
ncbi:MAG: aminoacyl-tRNA hydrolase [Gemmatimonadetes bacterium 21-71-4]|nr:MAG: aminoacyl-tRNA hydrolase [Gemmatimonadetes bacterium 21-71-4]